MLNELYNLSNALSDMDINAQEWHREYKELPKVTKKAPCFRIWLSGRGMIGNIDDIDEELASKLRKYGNNQATFPAFNIAPLYRITDEAQIKALDSMINDNALFDLDKVKSWCTADNWRASVVRKINNCLQKASRELLKRIDAQNAREQSPVAELIGCAAGFSEKGDRSFRSMLEECVFERLQKREGINTFFRMLFYKGNPKKTPDKDCGTLSVILDLVEWQKNGRPVANEHTTLWINNILLKADRTNDKAEGTGNIYDAYGAAYNDVGEPMPSVKLKGFDVTLRAMFKEQKCQGRYGNFDDKSFPIVKSNRAKMKQALEWIASDNNEGVIWTYADRDEIVFVYPSVIPKILPKFASIFGETQKNDGKTEARFSSLAKEVTNTLRGLPLEKQPKDIRVFALHQIKPALSKRAKVVFNRNYSPKWFVQAAEDWQKGCKNIPDINLWAWSAKKSDADSTKKLPPVRLELLTPFPLQVPRIVNNVWKQNGDLAQGKTAVKSMQYYQGMELLLDAAQENVIRHYLNILLSHAAGLVLYIGDQQHRTLASPYRQAKEVGWVLSVLGLLLYKGNYKMEDYMENTAYLVGQTLKISDELHALYCKIVREGDIPPQLAGNSLFVTATETPVQAIAQLGVRMHPYIAWAERCSHRKDDQKNGLAGWYLKLYGEVLKKLQPVLTDKMRFDDFAKAQVFIGYLAAFPKSVKDEANVNDNTDTAQGDEDGQRN